MKKAKSNLMNQKNSKFVITWSRNPHLTAKWPEMRGRLLMRFETCPITCNFIHKMHLLRSHLDLFPANIDDYSDQHDEKLHQTFKKFEIYFITNSKISMCHWHEIPHSARSIMWIPHSTKANSSTKMADDDASFMDKFVKELESSLVELTQMKTQVEKLLVNILINK